MTVIEVEQAIEHIHGICLKTGPPKRIGVELEWLVRDARDPALPVPAQRSAAAVTAFGADMGPQGLPSSTSPGLLPARGSPTTEPGGQLGLSSPPADPPARCLRPTAADVAVL